MILHKLIRRYLSHGDDAEFYRLQAEDSIRWIRANGVELGSETTVLDLGCGHGVFGQELSSLGCNVTYADEWNVVRSDIFVRRFFRVNIDKNPLIHLGKYDVVICSNVLEHLCNPNRFCAIAHRLLNPEGVIYLSWTNWLSPWGGHEFSPFHYLGTRLGPAIYDRIAKRPRFHHPYRNLFPTYIGTVLRWLDSNPNLTIEAVVPRYYTELAWMMRVPVLREFAAWNCAVILKRKEVPRE